MNYLELLKETLGNEKVIENEPMSKHTTFRTGGFADIFIKIENIDDMKFVLEFAEKQNIPVFILGNGSNILVTDKGIRGIVCKINLNKFEVQENQENIFVTVGSRK